jgi:hypothetical protein
MNSDVPQAPPSAVPLPQIPVDPNLAAEQAQASKVIAEQTQAQAQGDTAAIMARYGTRLALAGSSTAPMSASPS